MPSLPAKSVKGANLKKWLVETIDKLIDYLHSQHLRAGNGILIRETPSGTIVELAKMPSSNVSNTEITNATQDISASVTGVTATIELSGSTSAVNLVGTGSVTISGNTNGEIEIGVSGGTGTAGFPNLLSGSTVSGGTNYPIASDSWLIGHIGIYGDSSHTYPTYLSGYVDLKVSNTATPSETTTFELYCNQGVYQTASSGGNEWFPVSIPIKAGYTIRLTVSGDAISNLKLYST